VLQPIEEHLGEDPLLVNLPGQPVHDELGELQTRVSKSEVQEMP